MHSIVCPARSRWSWRWRDAWRWNESPVDGEIAVDESSDNEPADDESPLATDEPTIPTHEPSGNGAAEYGATFHWNALASRHWDPSGLRFADDVAGFGSSLDATGWLARFGNGWTAWIGIANDPPGATFREPWFWRFDWQRRTRVWNANDSSGVWLARIGFADNTTGRSAEPGTTE